MHVPTGARQRRGPRLIDQWFVMLLLLASSALGDGDDDSQQDVTVTISVATTQTITKLGTRPTQAETHVGYGLQGCYRRPDGDRDVGLEVKMPLSSAESNKLTTSKCLEACVKASLDKGGVGSYSFAAVGEGRECYCVTKLSPQAIAVGPKNCSTPCAGSNKIACGGWDHISVYSLMDAAEAARYASQDIGTGDPGTPAFLTGDGSSSSSSSKIGAHSAAVAMGSLAGFATLGLLIFLGYKLYRRRGSLTSGRSRSQIAKATDQGEQPKKSDGGILVVRAPEPEEKSWAGQQRPWLGGRQGRKDQGRREEIMRVQFVHSVHPRGNQDQGITGGSTAYQQSPAIASPVSPADDGLRQRRRSSIKPVDWARFDAVIPNGHFSPANSPTRDRFNNEKPRRASMTVYGNSAWSASTAEQSPNSATTTVGSSILDVSPTSPPLSAANLNPHQVTAPVPAATGGLGDRAWSRRRLSTPFPPVGGSPTSSHSSGSRRSSLADIAGDYHGVRVGRVEQLREKVKEEEEEEEQKKRAAAAEDLIPLPLRVVKWKKSFADMRRAGDGAASGFNKDGVNEGEDDESPVLPVWETPRAAPQVEELSPKESSRGRFEDETSVSPLSSNRRGTLAKGEDVHGEFLKPRQNRVKAVTAADELFILPATTYDGGGGSAAARAKKMV